MSDRLDIAVRAWTTPHLEGGQARTAPRRRGGRRGKTPAMALIVDTETTTDIGQSLLYAGYQFCRWQDGDLIRLEEGLVYADDLPEVDPDGYRVLREYVADHHADTHRVSGARRSLRLLSRAEFAEQLLWKVVYKGRATLVMFNAPFDLSRLAIDATPARKSMVGGFSFRFWETERYRPRITVKSIDSKRSLKAFTTPEGVDEEDQLDLDEGTYTFRGNILDLRTLTFALTNTGHSLKSAGEAFGITHGKTDAPPHGVITRDHVDYCRRDVLATVELYQKAIAEYDRHPIDVQPTRIYSPASMAKGYLRAMGVQPLLERQPDFPSEILGMAMGAFYGGRAEVHHRRQPLPVQLVDFTSMYPTIVALMGLWPVVIAERLEVVDATDEVQELLDAVTLDGCFDPALWPRLVGVAQMDPHNDVVPIRAAYDPQQPGYTIGINHLADGPPRVYALADLVASALLTGRAPSIIKAHRFVPRGVQAGLKPIKLRGEHLIDPTVADPFKAATELRQTLKQARHEEHPERCPCSECQGLNFLKVFANSGAYGIFAEIVRQELPTNTTAAVDVHTDNGQTFTTKVRQEETPGEYFCPPIAACITAGARLMLAVLERCITDAGGTWVFCDTDSMAIVATPTGEPSPAATSTRALSSGQVDQILGRFAALNPYDPGSVRGSILRKESKGLGHCFAISAKRYVIYNPDALAALTASIADGTSTLADADLSRVNLKRSEHGLGHLLNPLDPERDEDRNWIDELWVVILAELGLPVPRPDWLDLPALSRYAISSPHLCGAFRGWNADKPWRAQVKPFSFMLIAHVRRLDRPVNVSDDFQLVGPYSRNPETWLRSDWIDRSRPDGQPWRITTADTNDQRRHVRVLTYADYVTAHVNHPESKFLGADGRLCGPRSTGPLRRRILSPSGVHYIGKEADRLEEVATGLLQDPAAVVTTLAQPTDTGWELDRETLQVMPNSDVLATAERVRPDHGLSDSDLLRTLQRVRAGSTPRSLRRAILAAVADDYRRR